MLPNLSLDSTIAVMAVVLCVAASVQCAIRFTKHDARLFVTLIFFSLSWAVLIPYYSQPEEIGPVSEYLPAYQGLLLTLAGGALRREAKIRRDKVPDPVMDEWDVWTLRALYALVLGVIFHKIIQIGPFTLPLQTPSLIGTAFDLLGFYSIALGTSELTRLGTTSRKVIGITVPYSESKLWTILAFVSLVYAGFEVAFTIHAFLYPAQTLMIPQFKYVFAGLKLAYCWPFLHIIVRVAKKGPESPDPGREALGRGAGAR